ncbi:MAG: GNAT family N-acetyltransferase, partial [Actinomycetota bacterium]
QRRKLRPKLKNSRPVLAPLPEPRSVNLGDGRAAVVRPAVAKDAAGWIKLLQDVAAEGRYIAVESVTVTRRTFAKHIRDWGWSSTAASIAAVEDDKVIGHVSLWRERGVYLHTAELGMSVAATHRRLGVGTVLIEGAVDWARAFDVEKLCLQVFPHNERARALYRKVGFVEEGLRTRHAKLSYGYEDLIQMSLWVS